MCRAAPAAFAAKLRGESGQLANKLASLAHHGLSRAIDPVTTHDGDTLFALATGRASPVGELSGLGAVAAELTARAIRRAVRAATSLPDHGLPAARDL
jgi:L-aminopeptidase/D-esterase-like protein